jgi:hypothetical protein
MMHPAPLQAAVRSDQTWSRRRVGRPAAKAAAKGHGKEGLSHGMDLRRGAGAG